MMEEHCVQRGEKFGVEVSRRHFGLLGERRAELRAPLCAARTREATLSVLASWTSAARGAAARRAS
jgi:hypothetical protein